MFADTMKTSAILSETMTRMVNLAAGKLRSQPHRNGYEPGTFHPLCEPAFAVWWLLDTKIVRGNFSPAPQTSIATACTDRCLITLAPYKEISQ